MKYSHSVVFTLLVYTEYVNGCFIRNCPPDSPASKMNSLDIGSSAKVPVSIFISSPEHEVVNVSYCDRSLSVVRPSVNNCLKKHLLWNYVAKFNFVFKIQQWGHDWSTTTTTTATTTKWLTSCSALKNHLLWNYQSKIKETLQEASLGNLLQKYNNMSRLINNNNNNLANFLFCFKKTISSETTRPDSLKLYRKFYCMTPWPILLDLCL